MFDSDPEINELKKELALLANKTRKINKKFTKFRNPVTNNKKRTSSSNYSERVGRQSDKAVISDPMKCFKCGKPGHFAKECQSAKKKDFNYYMQKAHLAKQKEQGVVLMAEHDSWLEDSEDSEPENLALMARITEYGSESDDSEEEDNAPTSAENEEG
ncbi:unnamed protein product [Cuscuta europaea]|uniref:CCHC-type domain-containing protein n=1 Tax=Cuscuta europaea TaxID=41803 RepID=A0A9P1EBS3_CUSEU|nr:unnamed protein product [Cuscuta europaea]